MDKKTLQQEEKIKEIVRGKKYSIGKVLVKDIKLLDKNARFMEKQTFDLLVKNIEKDGELSSLPFCYYDYKTNEVIVLSGNHRIKALKSLDKEDEEIFVMYNNEEMSKDERLRIQLSHNSISGKDDINILKDLYDSFNDVLEKELSGINDNFFEDFEAKTEIIESYEFDLIPITIMFFDEDFEKFKKDIEYLNEKCFLLLYGGDRKKYDDFLKNIEVIKDNYNVANLSLVLEVMTKLVKEYVDNGNNFVNGEMSVDGKKIYKIGSKKGLVEEEKYKKFNEIFKLFDYDFNDFVDYLIENIDIKKINKDIK